MYILEQTFLINRLEKVFVEYIAQITLNSKQT